jgi:predicted RNase H-like HicB family nuclease
MQYYVVYETDERGGWSAYAPDLPGLGVSAPTLDEVKVLIREGIVFHIKGLREGGYPVPEPSGEFIEVGAS